MCKKSGRPESAIFDVLGARNEPQKSCRVKDAAASKNQRRKLSTFNFQNYAGFADLGKNSVYPGASRRAKNKNKKIIKKNENE